MTRYLLNLFIKLIVTQITNSFDLAIVIRDIERKY